MGKNHDPGHEIFSGRVKGLFFTHGRTEQVAPFKI